MTSPTPTMTEGSAASDAAPAGLPLSVDFAGLFDAVPALIAVHDGPEHRYIYSNPAHDRAVGHRSLIGLPLREAMKELVDQNVFERFDRVFHTGEPDQQTAFKAAIDRPGGEKSSPRYYQQTLQPWRGSDGIIRGVMSFANDVTDQIEAREAAARQKAELEFALDVGGGVGTWDWEIATDTVSVDERLARLFDLAPNAKRGMPLARFTDGILPDDRKRVEAAIAAATENCEGYRQEFRVRAPGGDVHWVTARGRCIYDADGTPMHFPGVVIDITRQVEARQELERTYALLGSVLDNSASYVFAKDLEGRYILANRFYMDAFGETAASLYGRTDRDRFGEGETYSHNDRRVAETGVPIEFEEQAVGADGETIHAISIKFPLRDQNGTIFGTGSISTDITARKNAEAALELSEERRQRAVKAGSIGTFEYHAQEDRVVWDAMTYDIFGVAAEAPVTLEIVTGMLHPDDAAEWQRDVAESFDPEGDGKHSAEFRIRRKADGQLRWIEARGETSFVEGQPSLMLGTIRDITERKEYEERLRLLNRELKHRVKNLFAVTAGMIRMAGRQEPEMKPFAERLGARINSLAAAHTVGLDSEREEPLMFGDMLVAVLGPFLEDSGNRIRLDGPPVMIPRRIVTPLALIVYELATNAFKHGCLAQPVGDLRILWQLEVASGSAPLPMLTIAWQEECGQSISVPPEGEGSGFGSRLLAGSAAQMNAVLESSVNPTGIEVMLKVPLEISQDETRND